MVKRYRGGVISATEVETTAQSSSAVFNTTEAAQEKQAGTWPGSGITSVQIAVSESPFVSGYKFSSQTGFGTKYANMNPTNTSGQTAGVDYSADGTMLMVASSNSSAGSRRITAVNWNSEGGYGTFYTNPTSVEATGVSYPPLWAKMNRATNHAIYITGNSSATNTWRYIGWTPGVGWGTTVSMGSTVNTSHVAITPNWLVISKSSTYYYIGQSFGTGGAGGSSAWTTGDYGLVSYTATAFEGSPDGNVLVIVNTNTAPGLHAWNMAANTGRPSFKYANPGTGPTTTPNNGTVQWSKNSDIVAIGGTTGSFLEFYRWNKSPLTVGWGTKLSSPATAPVGQVRAIRWTPDEGALITNSNGSLEAWVWSPATGIGTKFSAPSISPGSGLSNTATIAVSPT